MSTRKVGSTGRFGSRYGKKVRDLIRDVEKIQRQSHVCPRCSMPHSKRVAKGVYLCGKCGNKFTGQAYFPRGG
ncbi:MAG: 50S ribosomal protein L37ae [Candidatus Aenigmarchaeota archaeon]|nr:50S ribosomal protein L37ae [Candidatus Aenigmarchaeota archaeon]